MDPQPSLLDREKLTNGQHTMRGFFTLFWIILALHTLISMHKNKHSHFMGVSLQFWRDSYPDMEALTVMILAVYLYSYIPYIYRRYIYMLNVKRERSISALRGVSNLMEWGMSMIPILMACFVSIYRRWPALQTGSLLMYSITTCFKIHSFFQECPSTIDSSGKTVPLPTLNRFTCFLWQPTLIYQHDYAKSDQIRKLYLGERTLGIFVIITMFYVVASQYVYPIILQVKERTFIDLWIDLLLPCFTLTMLFFFLVFEYILNWAAEITCYADRHFYSDWWNSTDFAQFARKWNVPVHLFLQRYVYKALLNRLDKKEGRGGGEGIARFLTFLFSSLLHELIMCMASGKFKLWMLTLQMLQIPLINLSKMMGIRRYPFVANCIWWISIIFGIPLIVLLYAR